MEIVAKIDERALARLSQSNGKAILRATERAIDGTARAIKDAIQREMPKVFKNPTPYTLNSLKVTLTKHHNMLASVWFKDPERMSQHYLVPEVEGGDRRLKGFEQALGGRTFAPGFAARLNRYGNMSYGQIKQILSVLKLANPDQNRTSRSEVKNRKPRDYVYFRMPHGSLPAGVYQRVQTGVGFGAKTKRTLPFGEWQKGRTRGRFSSAIRARGLKLVLAEISRPIYRKRLRFYELGQLVFKVEFNRQFNAELAKAMASEVHGR